MVGFGELAGELGGGIGFLGAVAFVLVLFEGQELVEGLDPLSGLLLLGLVKLFS